MLLVLTTLVLSAFAVFVGVLLGAMFVESFVARAGVGVIITGLILLMFGPALTNINLSSVRIVERGDTATYPLPEGMDCTDGACTLIVNGAVVSVPSSNIAVRYGDEAQVAVTETVRYDLWISPFAVTDAPEYLVTLRQ